MNSFELKAMLSIAKKMDWNGKPAKMVIETIKQMIVTKQCQELAACGDCDGEEETLLSIALLERKKLWKLKHIARAQARAAMQLEESRESWIINNCI